LHLSMELLMADHMPELADDLKRLVMECDA
jgi:hypothetical protein